uniref:Uncharacterized protein n=1 Tax=Arundo donax TaxID=35708 RepID=A0A0A8Z2K6_ARUDO
MSAAVIDMPCNIFKGANLMYKEKNDQVDGLHVEKKKDKDLTYMQIGTMNVQVEETPT